MAFKVGTTPYQVVSTINNAANLPPQIGELASGLSSTFYLNIRGAPSAATAGATFSIDPEIAIHAVSLSQNCTINLLNYVGHSTIVGIDRTASLYTITGFTSPSVLWPNGASTATTFSQLATSQRIVLTFIDINGVWYGTATGY